MDVILISFITLTAFICFFGIKIANWLSDEDSGKTPHAPQPHGMSSLRPSRYRVMPHHARASQSSPQGQRQVYIDRRHSTPARLEGF